MRTARLNPYYKRQRVGRPSTFRLGVCATTAAVVVVFLLLAHFDARADEGAEGQGVAERKEVATAAEVPAPPEGAKASTEAKESPESSGSGSVVEGAPRPETAETRAEPESPESGVASRPKGRSEHPGWLSRTIAAFRAAYRAFDEKVSESAHLDQQNTALRERVAVLETKNTALNENVVAEREAERAAKLRAEAVADGGLPGSRTLASMHPHAVDAAALAGKPPKAVFDLAMKAFSSGDYETSAVALVTLVDNSENDSYRTAQAYYLTGVSFYEVANYKRALSYFGRADAAAKGGDETYAPRALAWKALCYSKLGDERAQAGAIRLLIQRYPRSKEARRLNRNESS